jgi:plastocyanin
MRRRTPLSHDADGMSIGGAPTPPSTPALISRRSALTIGTTAVLAAVAAGCRDDSPQAERQRDPVEPNGIVVDVIAIDNVLQPVDIEITPGTEVRWTNRGHMEHNVFPVEGTEWGVATADFQPGATYSHVFTEVGTIQYICTIHARADLPTFGMHGSITVVPA